MNRSLLTLVFALATSLSSFADDGLHLGGYQPDCFQTDSQAPKWCLQQALHFDRSVPSANGSALGVGVDINYKFLPPAGAAQPMLYSVDVSVNDLSNQFDLESELPLIAHPQAVGFHRENRPFTKSQTVILKRLPGTRQFKGFFTFQLSNEYGAEYVEFLRGVDLLITGASTWISVGN